LTQFGSQPQSYTTPVGTQHMYGQKRRRARRHRNRCYVRMSLVSLQGRNYVLIEHVAHRGRGRSHHPVTITYRYLVSEPTDPPPYRSVCLSSYLPPACLCRVTVPTLVPAMKRCHAYIPRVHKQGAPSGPKRSHGRSGTRSISVSSIPMVSILTPMVYRMSRSSWIFRPPRSRPQHHSNVHSCIRKRDANSSRCGTKTVLVRVIRIIMWIWTMYRDSLG
jgi:hypothetical protein